jgi:hypothetical protein
MVAGIIFQLVAMGVFITCGVDFAMRVVRNRPYSFRLRQIAAAEQRAAEQGSSGSELSDAEKNAAVAPVDSAGASASGVSTPAGLDKPAPTSMQQGQGFSGMDKSERRKWALVLTSVLISSTMILTRGVFRSVELSAGWGGHLVETEIYQMVLDGIPMTIAVGIFNFLHPGLILGKKASWKGYY